MRDREREKRKRDEERQGEREKESQRKAKEEEESSGTLCHFGVQPIRDNQSSLLFVRFSKYNFSLQQKKEKKNRCLMKYG